MYMQCCCTCRGIDMVAIKPEEESEAFPEIEDIVQRCLDRKNQANTSRLNEITQKMIELYSKDLSDLELEEIDSPYHDQLAFVG